MMPIKFDADGNEVKIEKVDQPFMRGAMQFEDYNYD
jgi:hypothetical protein